MQREFYRVSYLVNEMFLTIQGEATWTGAPAVFVRLQGCGVGCSFCDTKHTWATEGKDVVPVAAMLQKREDAPTYTRMGADELVAEVVRAARGARLVVLTGGEPADYDLQPLSEALIEAGFTVQLETSGTSPIRIDPRAWVTISPKINQPGKRQMRQDAMARADEVKHPTSTERHLGELQALLALGWHRPAVPIWLQPLSQHPAATARCVQWCMDHGYRLSLQTHKYLGVR